MGGDYAIGNYTNAPWLQSTSMSNGWGAQSNLGNFGWGNSAWSNFGWGNGYSSTSSSTSKSMTYEERRKAEEEERNRKIKEREEYIAQKKTLEAQIDDIEEKKAAVIEQVHGKGNEINTLSDGSVEVKKDLKKMTFWQKAGRAAMQGLKGITNIGKSLIGFESDGSWNPWKCLRNVACAAVVAAVCVIAAPVGAAIATAGAAFAGAVVASIPTILAVGGLVTGAIQLGKGVVQATKADTIEEFDTAWQNIGSGTFIASSSVLGLKNIAKTAGTSCFKAGVTNMERAQDVSFLAGGGWKGFKASCTDARLAGARAKKRDYDNAYDTQKLAMENKLTELGNKISQAQGKEKVLLEVEHEAILRDYNAFCKAQTTADFKVLGADSKEYLANLQTKAGKKKFSLKRLFHGSKPVTKVKINGYKFKASELKTLRSDLSKIAKTMNSSTKSLHNLSNLRLKVAGAFAGKKLSYIDQIIDYRTGASCNGGMNLRNVTYSFEADRLNFLKSAGFKDRVFSIKNLWHTFTTTKGGYKTWIGCIINNVLMISDPVYAAAYFTKGGTYCMPAYLAEAVDPVIDNPGEASVFSKTDWNNQEIAKLEDGSSFTFADADAAIAEKRAQIRDLDKKIYA